MYYKCYDKVRNKYVVQNSDTLEIELISEEDYNRYLNSNKIRNISFKGEFTRKVVAGLATHDCIFSTKYYDIIYIKSQGTLNIAFKIRELNFRNSDTPLYVYLGDLGMPFRFDDRTVFHHYNVVPIGKLVSMEKMFKNCKYGIIDLSYLDTSKVDNIAQCFSGCEFIKDINLNCDLSNVTNMYELFNQCRQLEHINFGGLKTNKVITMGGLFCECISLKSLDLRSFRTKNVMDFSYMFSHCVNLERLNISSFRTGKAMNFNFMFEHCKKLKELNLRNFNTKNVESMVGMFDYCTSLKELNVSNFNTKYVGSMCYMFENCKSLQTIDLSSFVTLNCCSYHGMFKGCTNLVELNLKNFKLEEDDDIIILSDLMFDRCIKLQRIYCDSQKFKAKFRKELNDIGLKVGLI